MQPIDTTETRTSLTSRVRPSVRVLSFAAILAAIGAVLLLATPSWTVVPERTWGLPFVALVVAFALTEATALHVEIRKESHSLSLACIPLMFGLLYTSPAHVLIAYILGGGGALLWIRKSSVIKVTWNACLFVAQVGLAGFLIRISLGERLPDHTIEWIIPLGAVVAAELLSLIAVPLVIMAVDAKFRPNLFANVGQSQILAVLAGTFAVTALSASHASRYMAIYAFFPLIGVGALLRSSGHLSQRFRDLQQLLTFTHSLANERGARTLDTGLIDLAQIMRARSAGLAVVGQNDDDSTLRLLVDDAFEVIEPRPLARLLVSILDRNAVTELDLDDDRPEVRQVLELLGARKALAVRVLSEVDAEGALFICDRLGMRSEFLADELRLFGSLANTLSSRLSNDHLVGRLETQARTDSLTGLPNRLSFEIGLTANLARPGASGALVMIDLDRFKEINDSLGHDTGDRLLIEVADRLRSVTRSTDIVARFGGDEFAVSLVRTDPTDQRDLNERVAAIREALVAKVEIEGITFEVGASVGAVLWPKNRGDSTTLLHRADTAMYEAKRNQLGVVWYKPELDADAPRRLDLYMSVSSALEEQDFFVHFQPKVSLRDGTITGAEALVRWNHPEHGPISPAEFVPLIVQAGLIGKLTRLMARRSIEAAAAFHATGLAIPIAVNLTPRDLLDAALVDDFDELLFQSGVEPGALTLEITEDAMVVDFDTSIRALTRMRELGLRVAIDDFGTGYSSLQHLHRLPVDDLKIDRSFVARLTTDDSAEAIVRASINLARDLRLTTVGEGVEDALTLRLLAQLGCDEVQGFYVSRPQPLQDLIRWTLAWEPARLLDQLTPQALGVAAAVGR
jgi:diguanylate cyclase (GGDEF)-like protein